MRDKKLILEILKWAASHTGGKFNSWDIWSDDNEFTKNHDKELIMQHVELMVDAYIIETVNGGSLSYTMSGGFNNYMRINNNGFDYLEASNNSKLWDFIKTHSIDTGLALAKNPDFISKLFLS